MKRPALVLVSLLFLALGSRAGAGGLQPLGKAEEWLNSDGQAVERLKGQVVLVDFWTYTCVNWLRTLPYLRAWQDKYRARGFVIVGVHSPEFEFEKNVDNIRQAAQRLRVNYPIAVDSRHAIWRAYENEYWPAVYLIDRKGRVRFHHFGEGNYAGIEREIQKLLAADARDELRRMWSRSSRRGQKSPPTGVTCDRRKTILATRAPRASVLLSRWRRPRRVPTPCPRRSR